MKIIILDEIKVSLLLAEIYLHESLDIILMFLDFIINILFGTNKLLHLTTNCCVECGRITAFDHHTRTLSLLVVLLL